MGQGGALSDEAPLPGSGSGIGIDTGSGSSGGDAAEAGEATPAPTRIGAGKTTLAPTRSGAAPTRSGAAPTRSGTGPTRRNVLSGAAALALPARSSFIAAGASGTLMGLAGLVGCRSPAVAYTGGWVGAAHERGHLLQGAAAASGAASGSATPTSASFAYATPTSAASAHTTATRAASASATSASRAGSAAPSTLRRADVVIVGAGVAGLGAARALAQAGIDDVCLLELEDSAGGNSRGHTMDGMRCPLGAHYLPLPGDAAHEVGELLEALGVRRSEHGRTHYDERMLCHSPQERLFIGGAWREGLLPPLDALPAAERGRTSAEYVAFAQAVEVASRDAAFAIPTVRSRWGPGLEALDAMTFAAWLDDRGLVTPALRWYLDYCCLDDYGAGSAQVSAWAGLHYFASRHGFRAPSDEARSDSGEGVLVWPEGNAWLSERMAAPFAERLQRGRVVLRVDEGKDGVGVDCWNVATAQHERWRARVVVLATPLFIAARLLTAPPPALLEAARSGRQAPWLVANLQLRDALQEHPGAPLSWDNVLYARNGLGYVDAMHQALRPYAGPTVLTAYRALGGDDAATLAADRRRLLDDPWTVWAERVVSDLELAHPDLRERLERIDLMRYGHAMSVPTPGRRSSPALRALAEADGRVQFAHSDLSAYSVFEEALYHGMRAGRSAMARLRG